MSEGEKLFTGNTTSVEYFQPKIDKVQKGGKSKGRLPARTDNQSPEKRRKRHEILRQFSRIGSYVAAMEIAALRPPKCGRARITAVSLLEL